LTLGRARSKAAGRSTAIEVVAASFVVPVDIAGQ
jgi:hypothetical protein